MQSTPESYNTTSQEKQGKKKQIKKLRSLSEETINACDLQTISSWKKLESLKEKHTALIWNHRKKKKTVQQLYLKGLMARNMTVQRLIQERNNLSSLLSNQYCSIYKYILFLFLMNRKGAHKNSKCKLYHGMRAWWTSKRPH
jgi:hypothetical protein